jgi:hypothetical protein
VKRDTRFCAVCHQRVKPTSWGGVTPHMDSLGKALCPFSNENYEMAIEVAA